MKRVIRKFFFAAAIVIAALANVEAQNSFAYQAVIRTAKGELVSNKEIAMQFSLIYDGKVVYCETQTPTTSQYGNVKVEVGNGRKVSGDFAAVPWSSMQVMMKIEADPNGGTDYIDLGTIQLQPAPYAMYATAAGMVNTIEAGEPKSDSNALFEVKDKDGNVVFAVYRDGVRVFVDDTSSAKAMRTGFAVSGRRAAKEGGEANYFEVTAGGTQVLVDEDTAAKAVRTGFAVASRRAAKDGSADLFTVSSTGTQIYIGEQEGKPISTGFAVSGRRGAAKGEEKYLEINADGTRVYVDDDSTKAVRTGFAVSGRRAAKGESRKFMEISADGTKVYVDDADNQDGKPISTGFAVSGRRGAAKGRGVKLFEVNGFGTQIYIDTEKDKAQRTGFAVSGRRAAKKGEVTNKYMVIDADGTRIYVDYEEAKAMRTGFAVSGRRAAKNGTPNTILKVDNAEGTRAYIDDNEGKAMQTGFAVSGRRAAKEGAPDLLRITSGSTTLAAASLSLQDKETDKDLMSISSKNTSINTDDFSLSNHEDKDVLTTTGGSVEVKNDLVVMGDVALAVVADTIEDILPVYLAVGPKIDTVLCADTASVLEAPNGYMLLKIYGNGLFAPNQNVDVEGNNVILFDANSNPVKQHSVAAVAVILTDASTSDAKLIVWPLKQTNNLEINFGLMAAGDTSNRYVPVTALVSAGGPVECRVAVESANKELGTVEVVGPKVYSQKVELTPRPAVGYHFTNWSDGRAANPRTALILHDTAFASANFEINTYNIFASAKNGKVECSGNQNADGTYTHGTPIELTAIASEHYHFDQWADGSTDNPRRLTIVSDTTFEALFALDTHTVTVMAATGGKAAGSGTFGYGTKAELTATADSATGYHFTKWSDGDNTNPRLLTVKRDTTIEAIFTLDSYTVAYIVDDEVWGETEEVDVTTPLVLRAEPTKYGYTFSGWSSYPSIPATMPKRNVTIVGEFTPNSHTVAYMVDDKLYYTDTIDFGERIMPPSILAREGYTFSGWKDAPLTMPDSNLTLQAYWSANKHNIIYMVDGMPADTVFDVAFGTQITPIDDPKREGYTFSGWDLVPLTMPDEDIVVNGSFSINKYTVKFMNDGNEVLSTQFAFGTMPKFTSEANPTREVTAQYTFSFKGWTPEFAKVTGPQTYTAVYDTTVNKYIVTFKNGDTVLKASEFEYGQNPEYEGEMPTKESTPEFTYTFNGWDKEIAEVTGDVTYTAQFASTVKAYTVKFVNYDDTELQSAQVEYGQTPQYIGETPTKESTAEFTYSFEKWEPAITEVTKEQTYIAKFTENRVKYALKFMNGEDVVFEKDVENGSSISAPQNTLNKEGYTFLGWAKSATATKAENVAATMPTENITYYAVWQINQHSLTWDANGGSTLTGNYTNGSVDYGTQITPPAEPTREGYAFAGWATTANATTTETMVTTVPDADVTYYAVWKLLTTLYVAPEAGSPALGTADKPFGSIADAAAAMNSDTANYTIRISGKIAGAQGMGDTLNTRAKSITLIGARGLKNGAPQDTLDGGKLGTTLTIGTSVPVTVKNLAITGGQATNGGGINIASGASVALADGAQISGNTASGNGGAVYVGGNLAISGSAYIPAGEDGKNDIYLTEKDTIIIAGALDSVYVGTITLQSYPAQYDSYPTVFKLAEGVNGTNCVKFKITPSNGGGITYIWYAKTDGTLTNSHCQLDIPNDAAHPYVLTQYPNFPNSALHPEVQVAYQVTDATTDRSYYIALQNFKRVSPNGWGNIRLANKNAGTTFSFYLTLDGECSIKGNSSVPFDYVGVGDARIIFDAKTSGTLTLTPVNRTAYNIESSAANSTITYEVAEGCTFSGDINGTAYTDITEFFNAARNSSNKNKTCTISVRRLQQVTFVGDADMEPIASQSVGYGLTANVPTFTREGYIVRWFSNEACTEAFDFAGAITSDTTLYAKWMLSYAKVGGTFYSDLQSTISAISQVSEDVTIELYGAVKADELGKADEPNTIIYAVKHMQSQIGVTLVVPEGANIALDSDCSNMFSECSNLVSADLRGFNTSGVTNMSYMFYKCSALTMLDVSGFNTANVTNMLDMFGECKSLTTLDLSNFNTSNCRNSAAMFENCDHLTTLDLSSFNTSKDTSMICMFQNCPNLTTIYAASGANWSGVGRSDNMFYVCTALEGGNGTKYNSSYIDATYARVDQNGQRGYFTDINSVYGSVNGVYYNDLTDLCNAINTATGSTKVVLTSKVMAAELGKAATSGTIINAIKTNEHEDARFNLVVPEEANIALDSDCSNMFYECGKLVSAYLRGLKTGNVTDMSQMFSSCQSLKKVDVSGFNTRNVTNMSSMFYNCSVLTSLDVSNFNTANVTDMSNMFGSSALITLDLSCFNTGNVTSMAGMFWDCSALTTIYAASNADWSNTTATSENMFRSCTKLVGGNGTTFSSSHIDATYARIDGGESAPGYFTEKRICYYIKPNGGNDSNSGLSAAEPLQSLEGALLKMNDATTSYTLYIDGTLTGKQSISPIINNQYHSVDANSLILCGLTSEAKIDAGCDENNTGSALSIGQVGFPITITNLTITGGYTGNGGGISFFNMSGYDCTLTLAEGAVITGNNATGYGGGIYIQDGPVSLVINGGTVSGNNAAYGGGVYYGNGSGNFTMNSGTISGNTANEGGGVFIARTFDMKGGEISENTAQKGGAVYYGSYGCLYMSGNAKIPFGVNGQNEPGKNDVYLAYNSSKPENVVIKVDGKLLGTGTVATITTDVWHRGMTVLTAPTDLSGGITNEIAARFALSEPDFTISTAISDNQYINPNVGIINAPIYVASANSATRKQCGEPAATNTIGTKNAPLASMSQVANLLAEKIDYKILIDGEITGENAQFAISSSLKNPASVLLKGVNGDNSNDKLDRALTTATENGSVINIEANISRFEIQDLTITGGNTTGSGGGINIWSTSLYLGKGTLITGNQAGKNGGGVYVSTTSKLFLYGDAKIGDGESVAGTGSFANKAKNGGGVSAKEGGSVYLGYVGLDSENQPIIASGDNVFTGGIFRNYATENGGGMSYESTAGVYNMAGGSVSSNAAASNGGGVYIPEDKSFSMSSGTMQDNAASEGGAVFVGGTFNIGGSAIVASNNDVYLAEGKTITIAGKLTAEAPVATITPSSYSTSTQVLDGATTNIEAEYGKFAVSESGWKIDSSGHLSNP